MKKIFIMDDDRQYVEIMRTLLEATGYDVSCACSVKEGLAAAPRVAPDLILLDLKFEDDPEADGIRIAGRFAADPVLKNTPVILISGFRSAPKLVRQNEATGGATRIKFFLEKPVRPDKLLARITELIGPAV
ncbi:response regulator [bacterium]|nr:response regulator [candidate division CSSED10-310 bacterium]